MAAYSRRVKIRVKAMARRMGEWANTYCWRNSAWVRWTNGRRVARRDGWTKTGTVLRRRLGANCEQIEEEGWIYRTCRGEQTLCLGWCQWSVEVLKYRRVRRRTSHSVSHCLSLSLARSLSLSLAFFLFFFFARSLSLSFFFLVECRRLPKVGRVLYAVTLRSVCVTKWTQVESRENLSRYTFLKRVSVFSRISYK